MRPAGHGFMHAPLHQRSLGLAAAVVMLGLASGCTSPSSVSRAPQQSDGTLHGDFGDLQVAATMAVGDERVVDVSTATASSSNRTLRGVAFEGKAGSYVKVEVERLDGDGVGDGDRSSPEALLVSTRNGRPYVVAHGQGPARSTLWFQLLRDGTHYIIAKDASPSRVRTRVTEVLAPRNAPRADAPMAANE